MRIKSAITSPSDEDKLETGAAIISGYAWAGEQKVMRVEVSVDGGSRTPPQNRLLYNPFACD